MKKIILLLSALFYLNTVFPQNSAIAEYGVTFSTSLVNEELKLEDPDYYEHELAKQNSADQLKFVLKLNKRNSIFYHPEIEGSSKALRFAKSNTGGDHYFYVDLEEEIIWTKFPYWGSEILLKEKLNETPWELSKESREISGFVCFKANKTYLMEEGGYSREIKVEAWFTPEIPFSSGPKGYAGLPGLILELTENSLTFYLKELNFVNDKEFSLNRPTDGIEMSSEEFARQSVELKKRAKMAIRNSRG